MERSWCLFLYLTFYYLSTTCRLHPCNVIKTVYIYLDWSYINNFLNILHSISIVHFIGLGNTVIMVIVLWFLLSMNIVPSVDSVLFMFIVYTFHIYIFICFLPQIASRGVKLQSIQKRVNNLKVKSDLVQLKKVRH